MTADYPLIMSLTVRMSQFFMVFRRQPHDVSGASKSCRKKKLGTLAQLNEPASSLTIRKLLHWQIIDWTGLHWIALNGRSVTTVHELCLRQKGLLSSKHCSVVSQTRHSWLRIGSCLRQPGEMTVNQRSGCR